MKRILLIIACSILIRNAFAQEIKICHKDVTYFNDTISWELKNQLPDGIYKIYYDQSKTNLQYSGEIQNYQRVNKWTWYFESGTKQTEITYQAGVINGQFIAYYLNQQPSITIPYTQGVQNGSTTGWYSTGTKMFEGSYLNGTPSGNWKFYNADGSLLQEEQL
jgi:uncharacterized protein